MELIIISIGLPRGVISEGVFATLVIMAVVTTLMASPISDRLVGDGGDIPITESPSRAVATKDGRPFVAAALGRAFRRL